MIDRLNALLSKFVGPNAAHVIDGIVGFELAAGAAACATPSARDYAAAHPFVAIGIALGAPVLSALSARFRGAAQAKTAPSDPPQK